MKTFYIYDSMRKVYLSKIDAQDDSNIGNSTTIAPTSEMFEICRIGNSRYIRFDVENQKWVMDKMDVEELSNTFRLIIGGYSRFIEVEHNGRKFGLGCLEQLQLYLIAHNINAITYPVHTTDKASQPYEITAGPDLMELFGKLFEVYMKMEDMKRTVVLGGEIGGITLKPLNSNSNKDMLKMNAEETVLQLMSLEGLM